MKTTEVDVSALAPPEPMQVILSTLSTLPDNGMLKVLHRREPFPLYERLIASGWVYYSEKIADDQVVIHIAHQRNSQQFTDFIVQRTSTSAQR